MYKWTIKEKKRGNVESEETNVKKGFKRYTLRFPLCPHSSTELSPQHPRTSPRTLWTAQYTNDDAPRSRSFGVPAEVEMCGGMKGNGWEERWWNVWWIKMINYLNGIYYLNQKDEKIISENKKMLLLLTLFCLVLFLVIPLQS